MPANRPEFYLTRLREIARSHGGALLSPVYRGDRVKLRFRCAEGHVWTQAPGDVWGRHWCARCAIARRAAKRKAAANDRLWRLVIERGGIIVSPEYVNSSTPLRFRCREGHEWNATPKQIQQGRWCPKCAARERSLRRREPVVRRLRAIASRHGGTLLEPGFVGYNSPLRLRCAHGHAWTMMPGSLDAGIWCPHCKEQRALEELRRIADRWGGRCLSSRWTSYRGVLLWECAQGHRFRSSAERIRRGGWCGRCRSLPPADLAQMRALARARGGRCLSTAYLGSFHELRWRCAAGHEWKAKPGSLVQGSWCPECARTMSYSRARLSIDDMRQTAAERGGRCLSEEYYGNKVPLRWRCARGHTWMAHPNRVRQRSWCPVCAHTARGTLDGMRALAAERGGRCLTRSWSDHRQPLLFECARGHRFHARSILVKTGVWCPHCRA